jgi:hypothetical protein
MSENDESGVRLASCLALLLYVATALLALVLWQASVSTTGITRQDLQAIAENNATLENVLTIRKQDNWLTLMRVKRVVDDIGRRPQDVVVSKATQQAYDWAQQAQAILEEAKPQHTTFLEAQTSHQAGIDKRREQQLKQQVQQLLDSLDYHVTATQQAYTMLPAFRVDWQRSLFQTTQALLSHTALLISQLQLQELNASILESYASKIGTADLCFDVLYLGVFPRSKIVEEGSRYQATLCLASSTRCGSANRYPEIETDFGKLDVRSGVSKLIFTARASQFDERGEAHLSWQGKIYLTNVWLGYDYRPDTTFLLRQEYTVRKKTPSP